MAKKAPKTKKKTKKQLKKISKKSSATSKTTPSWFLGLRPSAYFADKSFQKYFWYAVVFFGLISAWMSTTNGINGDDVFQNYYADHVLDYYTTLGRDTSVLTHPRSPIDIYGGLYEIMTAIPNRLLGLTADDQAYHSIRHVISSLFGLLAMVFTGLIIARWIGWRWGLLGFLLLWLSPRFLGHSFMNPKDIPFAGGYMMSLYFMLSLVDQLPKPSRKTSIGFVIGFGIAFGIRVGALVLIAYLGLLMLLDFWSRYRAKQLKFGAGLVQYLKQGLIVVLAGFALGILFWPYGLRSPISNTLGALQEFSKLSTSIRTLFGGQNIMSDAVPWYYLPSYMWRSIPIYALIGIFLTPWTVYKLYKTKKYKLLTIGLLLAAFFPIFYIIMKNASLYDGWRHVTFAYPPMIVLSVFGFYFLWQKFANNAIYKKILMGLLVLSMLEPLSYILRNHTYPYTYFNAVSGGISSAFGRYETDYYGLSVKQAFEWMEKEGLLQSQDGSPIRIATTFFYNLQKIATKPYKDKVKVIYTRYYDRYDQDWDYAIYPSRFLKGDHLRQGKWPTSKTIHTIFANNTPLVAIVKNENKQAFLGHQAIKKRDWNTAIELLTQEVKKYPDNESAWYDLAVAYASLNQLPKAQEMLTKLFGIQKGHLAGRNLQAIIYLNQGKNDLAESEFLNLIKEQKNYGMAHFYLSRIYASKKDYQNAIKYGTNAVNYMSKNKQAFSNLANIFRQSGQESKAKQVEAVMPK